MAAGKDTPKEDEKQEPSTSTVRRGSKSIWPWKKETDGSASFLRAARAGNLDKVLEFLKSNTDINTCNANGLNALHLASKEGHTSVVSALIERSANVDSATKKGNTALHIASLAGQDEIVKVLVENGACVNIQSQNGFTPLYMAAQENHDSVVRYLLGHGANQSLATEDGFTPLAVALQQGHDRVVSVLLENDTRGKVRLPALHIAAKKDDAKAAALLLHTDHNPDITSKSGFTPLHIASHYGNDNIAALLIQRGADVNYVAKHQITPLHVASKWGKGNMVSLLLDKGANIEAKTRDGLTPLHCAARSGHETVVDMLLEKSAPITAKTKNGLAPLHMASQGDHVDAARILLYHKAPVDDVTVDFLTALHVAAHCGHVRVAKLLLDRKADPNSRALNGFTPLHIACKKNRIKVVELLLKHGASIEATTESGLTPLHVASFMGCMNIVIYLIQHGASADVPTVRGESPLHLAARANQTDIIRILLRNGAEVDAKAREQQTALHIASRLGNTDIVGLLLQQGASVDAPTKDLYTPLHIAAKEGQEDVAGVLLDHGASLNTPTKKGFTPLHLAAKYGHMKVARLLLQREAPVDPKGKNGVTPLHVAAHYDHQNVALLLLDKGAQPHATAKNGYTPLHIAARKNQMDIAGTLLEYGASANAESKAGFTPLHLSAQEGHADMATLLLEHGAQPGGAAKNGLTPLHLCAQEDRVPVGAILIKNGATIDPETKAGYTPLHVASHFGQMNMVRFLLQHGTKVDAPTQLGYTPLHQAAQQGHTQIVNLLLENKAQPNMETNDGKTALSIAQKLGYISVVETLKIVTETRVTTNTTTTTEEKYKVVVPETMHETFMSESEDEGADDTMLGDQSYRYLTVDEMKSLGDDSLPIDVTRDEKMDVSFQSNLGAAPMDHISPQHKKEMVYSQNYPSDNVDVGKAPILAGPESLNTTMNNSFYASEEPLIVNDESRTGVPDRETTQLSHAPATGTPPMTHNDDLKLSHSNECLNGWDQFLVSFMVDARGGAMRGCRHSGVRVIIPPRKAAMPMRITCRYLKKDKLVHAPPLMEGEALASRILEMGPSGGKFLGPVIIEVPHFASLRGKEREIVILRSDNGETWREHTLEATEEAVQEVLNESFDGEELKQLEDLNTNRITRILTTDFPQYFAIVTRIRQEVHAIGPEGGMVSSTVVPQVQAVFPQGALTKKIKVGLQAQPISTDLVAKLLGNRVAVSPIVTVEPRRRKFHKPITLTIPVPQASSKGMINQYSGEAPTLRLLCSITGGTTRAQWEDVTGSTPLTFVNDCVSFTTTVSARFWLMDCTNIPEATKMATELYREAIHVPFMAKFVVFSKRHAMEEARVRVFCMTDDKEDKTLETQEHFIEVAKSRDVEVLEGKSQYLEFAGNLIPVTKSGDQLAFNFYAFRENRLPFTVRVKDQNAESVGRVAFMRQPKVGRGDAPQNPICNLNLSLPDNIQSEPAPSEPDLLALEKKYAFLSISKAETIHKADLRLSDISNMLAGDWVALAKELEVSDSDINIIKSQYSNNIPQQAIVMLRLWMQLAGNKATGNTLEKALRAIQRDDIVNECICNLEVVTDDMEKAMANERLEQSTSLITAKEDAIPSRKEASPEVSYDEKDIMKEAESAEEEEDSHKILPVPNGQEEVSEIQVVPEPRTSGVHPTSLVIVESVGEPRAEEIVEPALVETVADPHRETEAPYYETEKIDMSAPIPEETVSECEESLVADERVTSSLPDIVKDDTVPCEELRVEHIEKEEIEHRDPIVETIHEDLSFKIEPSTESQPRETETVTDLIQEDFIPQDELQNISEEEHGSLISSSTPDYNLPDTGSDREEKIQSDIQIHLDASEPELSLVVDNTSGEALDIQVTREQFSNLESPLVSEVTQIPDVQAIPEVVPDKELIEKDFVEREIMEDDSLKMDVYDQEDQSQPSVQDMDKYVEDPSKLEFNIKDKEILESQPEFLHEEVPHSEVHTTQNIRFEGQDSQPELIESDLEISPEVPEQIVERVQDPTIEEQTPKSKFDLVEEDIFEPVMHMPKELKTDNLTTQDYSLEPEVQEKEERKEVEITDDIITEPSQITAEITKSEVFTSSDQESEPEPQVIKEQLQDSAIEVQRESAFQQDPQLSHDVLETVAPATLEPINETKFQMVEERPKSEIESSFEDITELEVQMTQKEFSEPVSEEIHEELIISEGEPGTQTISDSEFIHISEPEHQAFSRDEAPVFSESVRKDSQGQEYIEYSDDDLVFENKAAMELEGNILQADDLATQKIPSESNYSEEPEQLMEHESDQDSKPLAEADFESFIQSEPPNQSEPLVELGIESKLIESEGSIISPVSIVEVEAADSERISETEELDESAPQDGFTQPSAEPSQMVEGSIAPPEVKPPVSAAKELPHMEKEIGDIEALSADGSKLKAASKSPLQEVDLAVLDSLLSTQEAEVEEMAFSQSLAEAQLLTVENSTQCQDSDKNSSQALLPKSDQDNSKPDLPPKQKVKKLPPPPPPPRKGIIGESLKKSISSPPKPKEKETPEGGNHTSSDEGEEQLTLMRDSPCWEDEEILTEEPDEARPIKAEIKLLVKTTEVGKESIEIRSIREFVDPKTQAVPKEELNFDQNTKDDTNDSNSNSKDKKYTLPHRVSQGRTPSPRFVRPTERGSSSFELEKDDFDLMAQVRDILPLAESETAFITPIDSSKESSKGISPPKKNPK